MEETILVKDTNNKTKYIVKKEKAEFFYNLLSPQFFIAVMLLMFPLTNILYGIHLLIKKRA